MMINLDSYTLEFECPKCDFYNPVTIKQVRLRDAVICRGCKITINLEDHMNETKKAVRTINKAFKELEKQFSNFGTFTIRI